MANGLLVLHDPDSAAAAARALALVAPRHAIALIDHEVLHAGDLRGQVAAQETAIRASEMDDADHYLVIHLVGPDGSGAVPEAVATVRAELLAVMPTLTVRQWVVHLVAREWDEAELRLALDLRAGAAATDLAGVVVVGSAGEASPAHSEEEMAAMAADATYALLTTDLEPGLLDAEARIWSAGATSAGYRRRALAEALGALLGRRHLDDVVRAASTDDVSFGLGRTWAIRLEIDDERERALLARSPDGGNVAGRLRMEPIEFDRIPVEAWPDRITSYLDHLLANRLPRLLEQIERNVDDRAGALEDDAERAIATLLAEAIKPGLIDQGKVWGLGAVETLETVRRRMVDERNEVALRRVDVDGPRIRLEEAIRHLPHCAAAAARAVVAAVVAWSIVVALARAADGGLTAAAAVAGGVFTASVAAFGLWKVYGQWRLVLRRRSAYIEAIGDHLRWVLDLALVDAHLALIDRVLHHIGAPPDDGGAADPSSIQGRIALLRLAADEASLTLDARQRDRIEPGLGASRFAITLPDPADEPTAALVDALGAAERDRALQLIVAALFRSSWHPSATAMVEACLVAARSELERLLPADLSEVLEGPSAKARANQVLGQRAASLLRLPEMVAREDQVRRMLLVAGGPTGSLRAVLRRDDIVPGLARAVPGLAFDGGCLGHDDPDQVVAVHLVPLEGLLEAHAHDDAEPGTGDDESGPGPGPSPEGPGAEPAAAEDEPEEQT